MKWIYTVAVLFLLWSCSKEEKINTCGLIGEWPCCDNCPTWWNGAPENETWTFEADGDLFISNDFFGTSWRKWTTDGDCTELVFDPNTENEYKVKIEINGDELIVNYGSVVGERTFCRQ